MIELETTLASILEQLSYYKCADHLYETAYFKMLNESSVLKNSHQFQEKLNIFIRIREIRLYHRDSSRTIIWPLCRLS